MTTTAGPVAGVEATKARTSSSGRRGGLRSRKQPKAYLYLLPALLITGLFLVVPLGQTAWYSLWNWNGLSVATWAGLANYAEIVSDGALRDAFGHSAVLILLYSLLPLTLALVLTAIVSRSPRLRGIGVFRTILFLPQVIASVVVATTWVAIYSPQGLINQLLGLVGVDTDRAWLGGFDTALPAIGFIGTWLGTGLCLVLFLSGVSSIDREQFEAARLDGAGVMAEFFAITLPAIRGQIVVALTLTMVSALKTFDLVYVTTRGGPGTPTTVPAFEAYNRAFNTREVGSAAAVAVVLAVLILIITVLVSRLQPREVE